MRIHSGRIAFETSKGLRKTAVAAGLPVRRLGKILDQGSPHWTLRLQLENFFARDKRSTEF